MATELAAQRNPYNYDTCPNCGGIKTKVSSVCKSCQRQDQNIDARYDIDLSTIHPAWISEFRGLFYGEGSAMIIMNNGSYSPCLAIRLRDDDGEVIRDIQRVLGGRYLKSNRNAVNPKHGSQFEWRTTNLHHCKQICELLIEGLLPARKKQDIHLVLDFCTWRINSPVHFSDEAREEAKRRFHQLREIRQYRSC